MDELEKMVLERLDTLLEEGSLHMHKSHHYDDDPEGEYDKGKNDIDEARRWVRALKKSRTG